MGILIFVLIFVAVLAAIVILGRFKVRKSIEYKYELIIGAVAVIIILGAWLFVTNGNTIEERILSPIILPAPTEVIMAFPKLHNEQGLTRSVVTSFRRVSIGFSLGAFMAIALGVTMASFPYVNAFFRPVSLMSSYIPIVSFIPLTLAWWGSGEKQKIGFLFIACLVALMPIVFRAISNVNDSYLDVARTKGASQWQLLRYVLFPVAMPDIWEGLRSVFGVGWTWIVLAEIINAQSGIGYLMFLSERRSQTASTFALILIIIIMAIVCDKLWVHLGRFLFPHKVRR